MLSVPFRKLFNGSIHSLAVVFLAAACSSGAEPGDSDGKPVSGRDGGEVGDDDGSTPGDTDGSWTPPDVDAEPLPIPPDCGDGERLEDSTEECDDGNNTSGDGCDARCLTEPGYLCAQKGGGCESVCGDGIVVAQEACDDENPMSGDGCSQMCAVEDGYACPVAGEACEAARCGDGFVVGREACDDNNEVSGDGCSATCEVESGWLCSGGDCSAAECGDGVRAGSEQCDDGNQAKNDGCVADCSAREPFFACPVRGGECLPTTICGDGTFTANEKCDDGNLVDGDGCSGSCEVESGFSCPGGVTCETVCGDGVVAGFEQCDDGDTDALDGCNATCALEVGFDCPTPGAACVTAFCGNGKVEGLEQCDDGVTTSPGGVVIPNNALGDGCTPGCTREPSCADGVCVATCGDGIVATTEVCDDGNRRNGDGCAADCARVEPGFTCQAVQTAAPEDIYLPLVLRDFRSFNDGTQTRHPDFNGLNAAMSGIVRDRLGVDLDNNGVADTSVPTGSALSLVYALQGQASNCTSGAANFNDWYHDNPRARTVVSSLRVRDPEHDGSYVFSNSSFFPVDGRGWQDTSVLPSTDRERNGANSHNFGFTSEVRFWFTFKGTEVLNFTGDDDVWVFINNRLAVDLGGVHGAQNQTITLNNAGNAVCSGDRCGGTRTLGLEVGKVYEVVVFQAERHENASNYRLTLGNFISAKSVCTGMCGDGVRTVGEKCDDGKRCEGGADEGELCSVSGDCEGGSCVDQNTGAYGHCNASCSGKGAYCGDGQIDLGHEACDDGAAANDGSYTHCNPDCTPAPRCGDSNVDSFFGETCDQGSLNKDGEYGRCSETCRLGARCGDGTPQADEGEECDDGFNRSSYGGCAPGCTLAPYCGDGVLQSSAHEKCDFGEEDNVGGYDGCDNTCRQGAFCGDGHTDWSEGEECDDGNANNFDGCSADCENELILR